MKYLKNFDTHNAYAAYIVGSSFKKLKNDSVSYCKLQNDVHYNHYIQPIPKFLDILYSDNEGNLSFTDEVLPVSEGMIPIALCIASQGFFGDNEKARWMSLKFMDYRSPENGSLTNNNAYKIYWGNYETDIATIDNPIKTFNDNYNVSPNYFTDFNPTNYNKSYGLMPSLFDINGNWNLSQLGTINTYVVTDIDGKSKTNKLLETITNQPNWRTDNYVSNQTGAGYAPAATCCAKYHTLGTQSGDWYLGACGEMSMIIVQTMSINTKLQQINNIYPNYCINKLDYESEEYYSYDLWTSTEYDTNCAASLNFKTGTINKAYKSNSEYVIAMLQY